MIRLQKTQFGTRNEFKRMLKRMAAKCLIRLGAGWSFIRMFANDMNPQALFMHIPCYENDDDALRFGPLAAQAMK